MTTVRFSDVIQQNCVISFDKKILCENKLKQNEIILQK